MCNVHLRDSSVEIPLYRREDICSVFVFLSSGRNNGFLLFSCSNATVDLSDALKELDEDRNKEISSSSEDEEDMLYMCIYVFEKEV